MAYRRDLNKGIGVDNMHYLNDGLWKVCYCPILTLKFLSIAFIFIVIIIQANHKDHWGIVMPSSLVDSNWFKWSDNACNHWGIVKPKHLFLRRCCGCSDLMACNHWRWSTIFCLADGASRLRILATNYAVIKKKGRLYLWFHQCSWASSVIAQRKIYLCTLFLSMWVTLVCSVIIFLIFFLMLYEAVKILNHKTDVREQSQMRVLDSWCTLFYVRVIIIFNCLWSMVVGF